MLHYKKGMIDIDWSLPDIDWGQPDIDWSPIDIDWNLPHNLTL